MPPDAAPLTRRQVLAACGAVATAGAGAALALVLSRAARAEPVAVPLPGAVDADRFALAAGGRTLAALTTDTVTVVDVSGPAPAVSRTVLLPGPADRIVVAPDGTRVFAASRDRLCVVDTATGAVTSTVTVRGIEGLAVLPDGSRVFCCCPARRSVDVVDAAVLAPGTSLAVAELAGGAIALATGGGRVHVGVLGGVAVVDTRSGAEVVRYGGATPTALLASPDGRYLYLRVGATVTVVEPDTGRFRVRFGVPEDAAVDAATDPVTHVPVLAVQSGPTLTVVTAATGAANPARRLPVGGGSATAVRMAGGRALIAVEDRSGTGVPGRLVTVDA